MIKFRHKQFTLQEGHYTGPKDTNKVPGALEVIGKTTLAGTIIGATYGKLSQDGRSEEEKRNDSSPIFENALNGAKWGSLSGIAAKIFLNHVHKPMTSVKYQDIDRNIRQQFGIFRMSGVTVGDNLNRRAKLDERFSFNDRNVTRYKINFAIHNNRITMYTLGITDEELEQINRTLDYYCKKYFGMEYSARLINAKVNAYSAEITFTNSNTTGRFIIELAETLNTKINILDNNAIVDSRIRESIQEDPDERSYSLFKSLPKIKNPLGFTKNKYFLMITKGICEYPADPRTKFESNTSYYIQKICEGLNQIGEYELLKAGATSSIESDYLTDTLKSLHYSEGNHFTVGNDKSEFNIAVSSGVFLVCVMNDGKISMESLRKYFKRSEIGGTYLYAYIIKNPQEFKMLLGKVMKLGKPNVYTGKKKSILPWKR